METVEVSSLVALGDVNPLNYSDVFVQDIGVRYIYDHTTQLAPDGDSVVAVGTFPANHPTHANLPFMTGAWIKQA